jgi:hypothetical protein
MKREVKAHIEVSVRDGRALCGQPAQKVRPCPACLARWAALVLVHVQSPKGGASAGSLCGRKLVIASEGAAADAGQDPATLFRSKFVRGVPPPAYVSADRAREIVRDRDGAVPMCPACCVNLGRLDEAESLRLAGQAERGVVSALPVKQAQPGLISGEDED